MRSRFMLVWLVLLVFSFNTTVTFVEAQEPPAQPAADLWSGTPMALHAPGWSFRGPWEIDYDEILGPLRRPLGADSSVTLAFTGTGLTLDVVLEGWGTQFEITVDGQPAGTLGYTGVGPSSIPVVQGLAPGQHTVTLRAVTGKTLPPIGGARVYDLPAPMAGTLQQHEGRIGLVWSPATPGALRFHVYRQAGSGTVQPIGTTAGNVFEDANPPQGEALTYWVQAEGPRGVRSAMAGLGSTATAVRQDWLRLTGVRGGVTIQRATGSGAEPYGPRLASTGWGVLGRIASTDPTGLHALIPAELGDRVLPGDQLLVAPGGWAEISMDGEQYLRLDEGTRATVVKHTVDPATGSQETSFLVTLGRVWVNLLQKLSPGSRFEVATPTMVAGVRGTSFLADASDNQVVAMHGLVSVRTPAPVAADPVAGDTASSFPAEDLLLAPGDAAVVTAAATLVRDAVNLAQLPAFAQSEVVKMGPRLSESLHQKVEAEIPEPIKERARQETRTEQEQHQRVDDIRRQQLRLEVNAKFTEALQQLPDKLRREAEQRLKELEEQREGERSGREPEPRGRAENPIENGQGAEVLTGKPSESKGQPEKRGRQPDGREPTGPPENKSDSDQHPRPEPKDKADRQKPPDKSQDGEQGRSGAETSGGPADSMLNSLQNTLNSPPGRGNPGENSATPGHGGGTGLGLGNAGGLVADDKDKDEDKDESD